ncbi:MAG: M23 family metallopeptidase [Alphaproteobacteria bacterium]|nr:M23 family metallopeptidase [Alphaproteobacteria bacterium]MCL2758220.1 M23 family metallopeptidase [Alphaproteobacteria bacterium]
MKLVGKFFTIYALCLMPCALYANCGVRGVEASAPVLCGIARQGGMLYGELDDNWNVYSGDEKISMNGIFIIGLDRDHPENLQLRFCKPARRRAGDCSVYTYRIEQRTYQEQRITVSRVFDELAADVLRRIESENALVRRNRAEAANLDATGFMDMRLPDNMMGHRISAVFGSRRIVNNYPRRPHLGVDIAAPRGTKVKPVADGVVIIAADMFFNGKTIFISHGHGIVSAYMHMDSKDVRVGDTVRRGDVIGTVGSTGRSTGPHLHLGVYWRNVAIDPKLVVGGF